MKRTFCDRCEKQCTNTTVIIRIDRLHHTTDGQFVGEDEYKAIEICADCMNLMQDFMPQAFILSHHADKGVMEAAISEPMPSRRSRTEAFQNTSERMPDDRG